MAGSGYFTKVPLRRSERACSISSRVFMTKGPYRAIGSFSGFPDSRRNRAGARSAWTSTDSPYQKTASRVAEILPAPSFPEDLPNSASPSKR